MHREKNSKATRILAIFLAILLVAYHIPAGMLTAGFAQTDSQSVFALQITDQGIPVADQAVSVHNANNDIHLSGTTDANGNIQFPELTTATFGTNNTFVFTIGSNTFSKIVTEGTTDHITYDIAAKKLTAPSYFVSVNQNVPGTVKINSTQYSKPVQVPGASDVTVEITPAANYEIQAVKINGESKNVTDKQNFSDKISAISADTTIEVQYAIITHTITFQTNDLGVIQDESGKVMTSMSAANNTTPSFTVVPNDGCHIQSMQMDGGAVSLPADVTQSTKNFQYTFTDGVTSDQTVTVTFAINSYDFTAAAVGGHGSISPETATVNDKGSVAVTLKPDQQYRVATFTINGTPVDVNQLTDQGDGTYSYTVQDIRKDTAVEVSYEPIPVLTGSWTDFVSVASAAGAVAKDLYTDGNNQIIVFSKDASLSMKPISPYTQLRILLAGALLFQNWTKAYNVTSSTAVSGLQVQQNDNKSQGEVNLNGGNLLFLFDTQSPAVDDPVVNGDHPATVNGKDWYSGNVTVSGAITNDPQNYNGISYKSDIDKVYYCQGAYSPSNAKVAYDSALNYASNDPVHYSFQPTDEDYSGDYSIWAVDKAGNKSDIKTVKINIDKTAPDLVAGKDAVTFTQVNDNFFAKAINVLTFGTFFKKGVQVTVHAADGGAGVQEISLNPKSSSDAKLVPTEVAKNFSQDGLTASETFSLDPDQFKGTFAVKLTDNAGNSQTVPVTDSNSNISAGSSGVVMIENNQPAAEITVTPNQLPDGTAVSSFEKDDNGQKLSMYNGDVTVRFKISDPDSGVNTVKIDSNGQAYKVYDFSDKQEMNPDIPAISTNQLGNINQDGSYNVKVYVIDNAGNTYTTEKTIYIDRTGPEITDFTFHANLDGNPGNSVEPTNYGFYFKSQTQVKVTAEDKQADHEAASGVGSITLYLKDDDKNQYYAVLANGTLAPIAASDQVAPIPTSGDVTFTIPENFKGQIFAKAADHVNNTGDQKSPAGTIIENEAKHKEVSNITMDKESTAYKDNHGLDLYAKDVPVKVTVSDPYSGIAKIDWSVAAPYDKAKNQQGTVNIDNDKNLSGDTGWTQTKTDQNLVTEMSKTILVTNDSNSIVLHVTMTDRAGNTSDKEITFSIDKTAPAIAVTYDNNSPDQKYTDYYKADRTATIVVMERNFRPEDFQYQISNSDGQVPKVVGWTSVENTQDPNKSTHIATIKYSADGDYTFNAQYKDNAQNAAAPFSGQTFTIDQTVPVVNVSYNNNTASNGNYYKAARTATITIKEHNFDPSRVKVAGSANDNSNAGAFPTLSGWSSSGDVHSATIRYTADGNYSFDIDFMDKAGNVSADYKPDQFIIDQTAPKLSITGVQDQSANKNNVIPVISYSDKNFNKNAVSIKLSGANRGSVTPEGSYAEAPNGQVFTFKNFVKEKKVDDIYTLTATLTDLAGNQSTQTIHFSVNRFGSVYAFAHSLKAIEGKYVKHERDVVVTETNVDTLQPETIKVKMTKNGNPSDLVQGKDYTVTHAGGDGKWSQYKYVIKKELFAGDGKYTVSLYSEDAAGNINENIDEAKQAEISFGVDKTKPVIIPVDFDSGRQYAVANKSVSVSVNDNLVLKNVKIYLNGQKVAQKVDGENYAFSIPGSNLRQDVKIVAIDAAGNERTKRINDFLVSTNPFVRWYNNTPLFMGSIGGVGAAGAAAVFLAVKNMRKEEED